MQCVYASTSLKGILYSPSYCFWPVWLSFLIWLEHKMCPCQGNFHHNCDFIPQNLTLYIMSLFLELPLSQKYHAIAHFYCKINYTPFLLVNMLNIHILNMLQTVKQNIYWNILNFNLYVQTFISKCMSGARKHISNMYSSSLHLG